MKKILVTFSVLTAMILIMSSNVFANSYNTTLTMAPNTILSGSPRSFDRGTYKISMYPTSFYNFAYCDIIIDLYRKDFVGKTFIVGAEEVMSPINTTYVFERGNHEGFNAFYYFKLVHGGISADPVILYTE